MKAYEIFKIVISAMAEKIDRLQGEVFCRDYEKKKLLEENERLKKENEALRSEK